MAEITSWERGVGGAGWQVAVYDVAGSTNDLARTLPAWSAVRAVRQTAGRGRFGRAFVSNEGGLWLSAVLPAEGGPQAWGGYSLMVGCHLRRALLALGLTARLRWPNDLMVADKKVGGLLIEQSVHDTLIVGLGLNVFNEPWKEAPELTETTTRLADQMENPPELEELTARMLDGIAASHEAMIRDGLKAATQDFNSSWSPKAVELTLTDGGHFSGVLAGLDAAGNLEIKSASGPARVIPHHLVQRLRELA